MSQFPIVRMRRLRENATLREMLTEVTLEPRHLILPLFVRYGSGICEPIDALPGVSHWSVDRLPEVVEPAMELGIKSFLFFGLPEYKDEQGSSAWDPGSPVQSALSFMRGRYPDAYLIADTCMCEYTSHGHCGHLSGDGHVDNDLTLTLLSRTAVSQARAGAHMVAPSDMMDGRVAAIRAALDNASMEYVPIMSYAAKLASAFYGPFREAAGSAPQSGNRKGYQLPAANPREILRDALLDVGEGADVLIVKPGGTCLDIAARLREACGLPLAGYVVSGEYMMLKSAAAAGALEYPRGMLEYHLGLRRAGLDLVITYFATEIARALKEG